MEEDTPWSKALLCLHCFPAKRCKSVADLNSHLLKKHGVLSSYICGHCKQRYVHKTSLMRHIQSLEREQQEPTGGAPINPSMPQTSSAPDSEVLFTGHGASFCESEVADEDVETPVFDIKSEAANFILNLRSSGNLTHASVIIIQEFAAKLLKNVVEALRQKTSQFLSAKKEKIDGVQTFVNETFDIGSPFEGLDTVQHQMDYFSSKFGLVVPEEKYLGYHLENRFHRESRSFLPQQVRETFQSISLCATLKLIVRNKFIRNLITSEEQSSDGIIRSFKDGSDFKNNTFLQKYPYALRINLYYDDLEIANPLGSKDIIHKLGCFYISIQNLPPEENSKLSSIFLLALCYAEDLKTQGTFAKVLVPFIEDLKKLQTDQGIVVDLPEGGTFILRACLVSVCADALAAHAMLGLLSPSAKMFCRFCLVSMDDWKHSSTAIGASRTSRLHEKHVQEVERNQAACRKYAVKERSPLSQVMRVPEDSVLDALHDFSGVIQMVVSLVLHDLICVRKLFSVFDLNRNINMFDYGSPEIKNKPSPNFTDSRLCSKGYKLKQSGSQLFCLLRILPFIVTGIEEDDKCLELIFLLQDIMKIIFSFEVKATDIDQLGHLIMQHNNLFHELFVAPDASQEGGSDQQEEEPESEEEDEEEDEGVDDPDPSAAAAAPPRVRKRRKVKKGINKLHHLLHYEQQLREKGNLIRLWCARFEARHSIFKKHSSVQSNFKNPPNTHAQMFQLSTLGAFVFRTGTSEDKVATSNAEKMLVEESPYHELLLSVGFSSGNSILMAKSAEIRGQQYSSGLFVALQRNAWESLPCFGLINDIVVDVSDPSKIFLVVSKCRNEGFKARFNSYKIGQDMGESQIVRVEDLANFRPIPPWSPPRFDASPSMYLYPRTVLVR